MPPIELQELLVMSLSLILLTVIISSSVVEGADITCIETYSYSELKDALRDQGTDNVRKMLNAFYPTSSDSNIHLVNITYYIGNIQLPSNYTLMSYDNDSYSDVYVYMYHWADNRLMLIIEPFLINILTFYLFSFGVSQLHLTISPSFCTNNTERHIELLDTLTTWVKAAYSTCVHVVQCLMTGSAISHKINADFK